MREEKRVRTYVPGCRECERTTSGNCGAHGPMIVRADYNFMGTGMYYGTAMDMFDFLREWSRAHGCRPFFEMARGATVEELRAIALGLGWEGPLFRDRRESEGK